ncbi:mediator complex subunit 24 [Arctopsyche grandis]|uniref:mediator complex subunit 24 n=1 Tax=Arctopsyche grandis TaxID=121162 RepID=UPI00406D839E
MEASKTTSKTSSLKALLVRAWRERWTDLQWGIHIKSVVPRGVSGDVYNLSDCILQQATLGAGAAPGALSYLRHSLAAHLVSYAAVLERIARLDAHTKPHCLAGLLRFVQNALPLATSRGALEEAHLAFAIRAIVRWLLVALHHALIQPTPRQIPDLRESPAVTLNALFENDFLVAMLYLAKQDDHEQYNEIIKKCQEIKSLVLLDPQCKPETPIEDTLQKLCFLELDQFCPLQEVTEPITYCIQALLAIELLANPNAETQVLINELLMMKRLKRYSTPRLYCELMRASLIALNDVSGSPSKQSIWGAFTFLKVPQIIHQLHSVLTVDDKIEHSADIVEAFEQLLQYAPLLDVLDSKCSCNCVQSLLEGLNKLSLVSDHHMTYFSQKREATNPRLQKIEATGLQGSIPTFIMRAEPTLAGILKTMSADFMKIQDALYSMLCQVLSGNSLEVILAVATVEGKLKQFVSKLIKFNECSLQISGDVGKASQSRGMLFDISFLILCAIVQQYGAEAVLDEGGDSFFEQWVRDCMVEKGVPKSPDQMLHKCDLAKVDVLLRQLNSPDYDFKSSQMKCHDLCINVCGAIKEVLFAWEQGSLTATDVKRILDALRQKMASLAVCASAWLCSYMHIVHQDALLKPMNMVQQFLTPLTEMESAQSDNFKERSVLMFQIIRKMQYDVHPPTASKTKILTLSHSIISRQPIAEHLQAVWQGVRDRGWLHIESTHVFESLLNTGGPVWFVSNIVREIMRFRYQGDLARAIDLAFALFHLNIEQCTQALLLQVLPQYLYNSHQSEELVAPQECVLAKLCVYCIYSTLEFSNTKQSSSNSKKRSRFEDVEDIEALCPTNKVRRLNDNTAESSTLFANTLPLQSGQKTIILKEPLQSALQDMFKIFSQLAGRDGEVSPQTQFIFRFLVYIVQCGQDRARVVLQGMPSELVPMLVKSVPESFTTGLLLRLYDLGTVAGRKATARDLCILRNMQLRPK